jgi:response regulator RpfG family c-di-GMP phosphodiesterase
MASPIKILFLDDEELILNALRRSLRREGYELYFSSDPFAATRLVGEHNIDIVVSDHMMPTMTGVEVLSLLKRLHPRVIRMMMTGQADRESTIRAINEGSIHRFIEKPWDDASLKAILAEAARSLQIQRAAAAAALPSYKSALKDASGAIVLFDN